MNDEEWSPKVGGPALGLVFGGEEYQELMPPWFGGDKEELQYYRDEFEDMVKGMNFMRRRYLKDRDAINALKQKEKELAGAHLIIGLMSVIIVVATTVSALVVLNNETWVGDVCLSCWGK